MPLLNCAIPVGGLSPDHRRWIRPRYPFFLPVKVLSRVWLCGAGQSSRASDITCGPQELMLA